MVARVQHIRRRAHREHLDAPRGVVRYVRGIDEDRRVRRAPAPSWKADLRHEVSVVAAFSTD